MFPDIRGHQNSQQGICQSGEEKLLGLCVRTKRSGPIQTDPKMDSYTSEKINSTSTKRFQAQTASRGPI